MTGVTTDIRAAVKSLFVKIQNHLDHLARRILFRLGVRGVIPLAIVVNMTKIAAAAHRGGEIVHYRNQLRLRHARKHFDVLLRLLDRLLLWRGCGGGCLRRRGDAEARQRNYKIVTDGQRFLRANVRDNHQGARAAEGRDDESKNV